MKRVTGIGGVFFKAKNPAALQQWYRDHLGIDVQDWGGAALETTGTITTAWCIVRQASDQFAPSAAPFMVNYRVEDVRALLQTLRDEGCTVLDDVDDSGFGVFGWVIDPEGNKVELWQPLDGQ